MKRVRLTVISTFTIYDEKKKTKSNTRYHIWVCAAAKLCADLSVLHGLCARTVSVLAGAVLQAASHLCCDSAG